MAGTYRGGEQRNRLLGELLTLFDPLARSQRHVEGAKLFVLFAVDHSPHSLVAG